MPLIDPIPVALDPEAVVRVLRLKHRGEGVKEARELMDEAGPLMHPRAFYLESFIESRTGDSVTIGGHKFWSRILRDNLERTYKVFPYVLTIGPKLESHAGALDDPLRRYYLEVMADMTLDAASEQIRDRIAREAGVPILSAMNPGSLEDWPITEQKPLFALLGEGAAHVGVRLSESLMMIPRKSVSGIFFPSEETFVSCRLCTRERCPGRKAGFQK